MHVMSSSALEKMSKETLRTIISSDFIQVDILPTNTIISSDFIQVDILTIKSSPVTLYRQTYNQYNHLQ